MSGSVLALSRTATSLRDDFRTAVLAGLSRSPRAIPAKYLYDACGSTLFDEICELPEYYLTRTETRILQECIGELATLAGKGRALIEFGSGSSTKSRLLLDALQPVSYVPIDISREHLDASAARLLGDYPQLRIEPICADYMAPQGLPPLDLPAPRLGFFPGSTIGNLEPAEATDFLKRAHQLVGREGAMVVGFDLKKDFKLLHDAYNDAAGVTAAFTLNLLRRMNRELSASFDLQQFAHEAFYNSREGRIEIYFRSLCDQSVTLAGRTFAFAAGERVHTEYSYKYDVTDIEALAASGGFRVGRVWSDQGRLFAVAYLVARA
jgi:dimethylhistidine N-methyltransferase